MDPHLRSALPKARPAGRAVRRPVAALLLASLLALAGAMPAHAVAWPPPPGMQPPAEPPLADETPVDDPLGPAGGPGPADMIEPTTDMAFMLIPGGCFTMGDHQVGQIEQVCLDEFYLGKYEVTNEQFRRFRPGHDSGRFGNWTLNDGAQPVANVSWQAANEFCAWLGERSGGRFRLPSEAEWEYAARAGGALARPWTAAADAYQLSNLRASGSGDGFPVAAPIGSFAPNPAGLYDMLGNVSEWVMDGFVAGAARFGAVRRNPVAEGDSRLRVRRGGSWDDPPAVVGHVTRDYYLADLGVPQTGFRLVMELR
jgi:formylglycine-generating enzyme required for sulfatase activity